MTARDLLVEVVKELLAELPKSRRAAMDAAVARAISELPEPVAGNTHACAARYGFTRRQLEHWRSRGGGPPYVPVGRHVRYVWADVDAWLRERRVSNTAEAAS